MTLENAKKFAGSGGDAKPASSTDGKKLVINTLTLSEIGSAGSDPGDLGMVIGGAIDGLFTKK